MIKYLFLAGIAGMAVAGPVCAKSPLIWQAHCIATITTDLGSGRFATTTYLTQRQPVPLPDDLEGGGSAALQAYSKASYEKWKGWRDAQPGVQPTIGDCHFDFPGASSSYDTRKKNVEESLSWGPDQYMKVVQFDFPSTSGTN